MFLPQFSVRRLLGGIAVCAGCSFVIARAVEGRQWAMAIVAALAGLVMVFLLHAVFFLVAYALRRTFGEPEREYDRFPPAALAANDSVRRSQ